MAVPDENSASYEKLVKIFLEIQKRSSFLAVADWKLPNSEKAHDSEEYLANVSNKGRLEELGRLMSSFT